MSDPLLDQFRRLLGRSESVLGVSGRRYRVTAPLAVGRSSRLWKARDEEGRRLALKRFHPAVVARPRARERIRAEVARATATAHGRLVPVVDGGEDAEGPFLVMERLELIPLESVFLQAPLEPRELVRLGRELACLLDELWTPGLVEGAFSPRRLFVRRDDGRLLAKRCSGADYRWLADALVPESAATVRDHWPAPEQLLGGPGDERSRLYSLGLILERCHSPRLEEYDPLDEEGLRPPEDAGFRILLDRLLEPDPEARLASTGDLLRLLGDLERRLG